MAVSDRKRDQSKGFAQLLRVFFQRHDLDTPDRGLFFRALPLGSLVTFLLEHALGQAQRHLMGITLVDVKRQIDLAQEEAGELRSSSASLQKEVEALRRLWAERSTAATARR
jgi:hypothetical protein